MFMENGSSDSWETPAGLHGTLKVDTKLWKCATASPLPSALVSAASATATQENIDQDLGPSVHELSKPTEASCGCSLLPFQCRELGSPPGRGGRTERE